MAIKRSRDELAAAAVNDNTLATLANYLMLLSSRTSTSPATSTETTYVPTVSGRVFECKTCSRQFPSFQALGGHRASHKKPRLPDFSGSRSSPENSSGSIDNNYSSPSKPTKSKTSHECSICGVEYALGQALGGHMRRHRAAAIPGEGLPSTTLSLSMFSCPVPATVKKPAVKGIKGDGGIRTLCLDLSL